MPRHERILVIGATGTQGGAVTERLLKQGQRVRALTREPQSLQIQAMRWCNLEVAVGDLDTPETIRRAMDGVTGVFSMQSPGPDEVVHSRIVVEAAGSAGVRQLVHSSVSGTGFHKTMPGWAEGRWNHAYWDGKWEAEQAAMDSGLPWITVLKPAFMMENFALPKATTMFPDLAEGQILTAVTPQTRIPMIAAADIGAFAAHAFADPERYSGKSIDLAGDCPTLPEVAEILSKVTGNVVTARTLTRDQLIARGQFGGWVDMQIWFNEIGYPASPKTSGEYGVPLTDFSAWAYSNKEIIN